MNACKEYDFDFTYVKYEGSVPCENINIALDNCEGKIIKIMFSDDIFMTNDALERIKYEYDTTDTKWAFSGFSNWDGNDYFLQEFSLSTLVFYCQNNSPLDPN